MKNLVKILMFASLFALPLAGCMKKEVKKPQRPTQLVKLVDQLNSEPDRELNNGMVLTGCEFKETDTVLTYCITVNDARFENVPVDSIKTVVMKDLSGENKGKIMGLLKKYRLGLRYICTLPDGTNDTVNISRREVYEM